MAEGVNQLEIRWNESTLARENVKSRLGFSGETWGEFPDDIDRTTFQTEQKCQLFHFPSRSKFFFLVFKGRFPLVSGENQIHEYLKA